MPDQAEIIPDPTLIDVSTENTLVTMIPRHKFTFPPWPAPPEGVTIMSFKNFKQRGIQIVPGQYEEEVDTLGIITVAVKTRHSNDVCKTNTKRKKRAEENAKKAAAGIKKDLWEEWEDKESTRMTTAHVHITSSEKIQQAAADFRSGRPWPKTIDSQHNPERIWHQFLNFCGLGDNAPQPKKKLHIKAFKADGDDDDDDFSDDDNGELADANVKERKISSFVDDPETTIKIFMSSYSRHKGLIWAEDNLKAIPRLMGFWIDFLLRNKVFPSSEVGKLKRAKDVTTLALKEYPLTAKISKIIPDEFSAGCNECWGTKADGYKTLTLDLPPAPPAPVVPAEDTDVTMSSGHITEVADTETSAATEASTTTEIPDESGWGSASAWPAADDGGWGTIDTSDSAGSIWSNSNTIQPGGKEPTTDDFIWSSSKPTSLLPLLGPTALPLTHVPGIVESSMRRVKSINLPPQTVATAPVSEGGPDAEAVELELEKRFARVVLSPWLDWDGGEIPAFSKARILESSVGEVVDPLSSAPSPPPVQAGTTAKKPHDPLTDDITVLLKLSTAQELSEGVGLAGTWVQLVRVPKVVHADAERGEGGEPPAKKKKKSKSKSSAALKKGGYWYVDDLTVTVPSFWAVVGAAKEEVET